MQTILRRISSSSIRHAAFSSLVKTGTKFAYECSPISSIDAEKTILERSLRSGCLSMVSRSSASVEQFYEFLYDLSDNEECDIHSMQLGHICAVPRNGSPDATIKEVESIHRVLKPSKRRLDFVALSLPSKAEWTADSVADALRELHSSANVGGKDVRIGVDLNTAALADCQSADITHLTKGILEPLLRQNLLGVLTVASNFGTHAQSHALMQWAAQQNKNGAKIQTVATELFRTHAKRPGVLSAGYHHSTPHRMTPSAPPAAGAGANSSNTITFAAGGADAPALAAPASVVDNKSAAVRELMVRVQLGVEDFKMALDRCMHAEKIFLSKVGATQTASVPVTDVCLAHVLSKTFAQFQSPEEWAFVLEHQINPKLERGLKLLGAEHSAQELRDWTTVYQPMSKYLLASCRHLLQEKSLLQSQEVAEMLRGHRASKAFCGAGDSAGYAQLAGSLAQFTAHWSGADMVAVAQNQVDEVAWSRDSAVARAGAMADPVAVQELYRSIQSIVAV